MVKKKGLYDDVSTLALKKGERMFPWMMFDEVRDWDCIYEEWIRYVKYCKRHGYVWKDEE